MTVSKTFTAGEVTVRYEADTIDELFALVSRFETDSDDGWIPWNGGECPVSEDTSVETVDRDGYTEKVYARNTNWEHLAGYENHHIVKYRVVS